MGPCTIRSRSTDKVQAEVLERSSLCPAPVRLALLRPICGEMAIAVLRSCTNAVDLPWDPAPIGLAHCKIQGYNSTRWASAMIKLLDLLVWLRNNDLGLRPDAGWQEEVASSAVSILKMECCSVLALHETLSEHQSAAVPSNLEIHETST